MNNNKKKLSLVSLAVLTVITSASANAELYISPVVKKSVQIEHQDPSKNGGSRSVKSVQGKSDVHGQFLIKERSESDMAVMRFGSNVPLFVAMEKVVPDIKDWAIHFDDGLENTVVNWEGGDTWEGVLKAISSQNNLAININYEEMAIGISKDPKLAIYLAKHVPEVWKVVRGDSYEDNLKTWAKKAGWSIAWDEKLRVDYIAEFPDVFTGKFEGKQGAVDQLMLSTIDKDVPLTARFFEGNKVVLIKEATYSQEVSF